MINPKEIIKVLLKQKIKFYTGVPDSTLKGFITELMKLKNISHRVAVNEGNAIGSAIGYYLATKKVPLVYMQNSGLTNALNPILTLSKLYSVPMILIIGWRGFPGLGPKGKKPDEPQHLHIGPATKNLLFSSKLTTVVLSKKIYKKQLKEAIKVARKKSKIIAILIKRRIVDQYEPKVAKTKLKYKRFDYLKKLVALKKNGDNFVATTGFSARELYFLNEKNFAGHSKSFYCVGAMGHAAMIATELANFQNKKKGKRTFIIDGDGAALMHLGSMTITGKSKNKNLVHIIFNNRIHESTGNHPISNENFNFKKMFELCGYKKSIEIYDLDKFNSILKKGFLQGPTGIVVHVKPGTIKGLPRQDSPKILKKILNF